MVKTQTSKYVLLQAVIVLLTAAVCFFPDALFLAAAVTVQTGIFAALILQKPFWLSLAAPVLSYGAAFALLGDPALSLVALLFLPAGAVTALCVSRGAGRSRTVLFTSLALGVGVSLIGELYFALNGGFSLDAVSSKLQAALGLFADMSVENLPDAYFSQGVTREAYRGLIYDLARLFVLGAAAFVCNAVSFFSTAITKRVLLGTEGNPYLKGSGEWLYVLSKPSAAAFLVCYLCVLVGGETLTLPQQIAFNTVIVALLGGVLVMAARTLRRRAGAVGAPSLLIYVVIYFIFGLQTVLVLMSITGLVAAFRYRPQGDKE